MPNLAAILKGEIRRLARREVRGEILKARRVSARYRSDIAKLKRLVRLQERKIAQLESQQAKQGEGEPAAEEAAPRGRFSARSVRAQRRRLKLPAHKYAKLIGVSPQTIYFWERGVTRPRKSQFAALVAARSLTRREALQRLSELEQSNQSKTKQRKTPRKARVVGK